MNILGTHIEVTDSGLSTTVNPYLPCGRVSVVCSELDLETEDALSTVWPTCAGLQTRIHVQGKPRSRSNSTGSLEGGRDVYRIPRGTSVVVVVVLVPLPLLMVCSMITWRANFHAFIRYGAYEYVRVGSAFLGSVCRQYNLDLYRFRSVVLPRIDVRYHSVVLTAHRDQIRN
ncbi:hypothetical protein CBL_14588 [Carabus blaptoides fortunei]